LRVLTVSDVRKLSPGPLPDSTAQVWDVLLAFCASPLMADRLASVAEAVSGYELSDTGSMGLIGIDERRERLKTLRQLSGMGNVPNLSVEGIIRRFAAAK